VHPDVTPIGNDDWIVKDGLVERNSDGQTIPLSGAVECDNNECSEEATCYYRHQCCNYVSLSCEGHRAAVVRFLMSMQQRGEIVRCFFCKTNKIPITLITRPQSLRLDSPPQV
jgi:hypothetical protein